MLLAGGGLLALALGNADAATAPAEGSPSRGNVSPASFKPASPALRLPTPSLEGRTGIRLQQRTFAEGSAPLAVVTVQSTARTGTTPSAADNDYTRLNIALQGTPGNSTVELDGSFSFAETFARAAWALGSDGTAGTGDDYSILPAPGRSNVRVTAVGGLGSAVITGPGDVPTIDLEGVFYLVGGNYQGWSFSNLDIRNFDLSIGMYFDGGGPDSYDNVQVTNNRIVIASDVPQQNPSGLEFPQNVGLNYAHGSGQVISGNVFELDGGAPGNMVDESAVIGMQSDTSGGAIYEGLVIENNEVNVRGAPNATRPAYVVGIWENAHAHLSNIRVRNNRVTSEAPGAVAGNLRFGFLVTSHSSDSTQVSYRNNTVTGMQIGFVWDSNVAPGPTTVPLSLTGNTITGNGTGARIGASTVARVDFGFNRIAGNGTGIDNSAGAGNVTAPRNWWGCNAGPNIAPCDSYTGTVNVLDWLTLRLRATGQIVTPGTPVNLDADVNRTNTGVEVQSATQFPDGTLVSFATNFGTVTPAQAPTVNGSARSVLTSATAGNADPTATLDGQTVSTRVVFSDGSTVLCVPTSFAPDCDAAFPTIQTAENNALPGSTIRIAPGVYDEQVVIDVDNLTVAGEGRDTTIVRPTTLVVNSSSTTSPNTYAAIVVADDVTGLVVRALTLDGVGAGSACSPGLLGLHFRNSSGQLRDSAVRNIILGAGGCQSDLAVLVQALPTPAGEAVVTLTDNLFTNYGKSAIIADGTGVTLNASGNAVTGRGPLPLGDTGQNGIQVSFGATALLVGNTFTGHSYVPGDFVAAGVFLFESSADLRNNTFTNNQVGLYHIDGSGTHEGNTFSASQSGTGVPVFWGAIFDDPPLNRLPQPYSEGKAANLRARRGVPNDVISGTFRNNTFTGAGSTMSVGLEADAGFGVADVEFLAESNTITGWGTGVVLLDCGAGPSCTNSDFTEARLQCNRIASNTVGLDADITVGVNAENNWWGCNAGPGGTTGCNGISGTSTPVDATPWLVMTHTADPTTIEQFEFSDLTVDFRRNSDGVDVSSICTLPDTPIAFTTTLGTIMTPVSTEDGVAFNVYEGTVVGTAVIRAILDQETESATVIVNARPDFIFGDGFEDLTTP